MPRKLPKEWTKFNTCGKQIEGTRIICFKVPLKPSVQIDNPAIPDVWDIEALLTAVPNLGLVIDLTTPTYHYDPGLLEAKGVIYKKFPIDGGGRLPRERVVTAFMNFVDEYINRTADVLVGVHCTHGLNRTGYMVCRYMRDRLGIDPNEAIQKFETARGYNISRQIFIKKLLKPLNTSHSVMSKYPPQWKDQCANYNVSKRK